MTFKNKLAAAGLSLTLLTAGITRCTGYQKEMRLFLDSEIQRFPYARNINKKYLENFIDWREYNNYLDFNERNYLKYLEKIEAHEKSISFVQRGECSKKNFMEPIYGEIKERFCNEIKKIVLWKNYNPKCDAIESVYNMYSIAIKNMEIIKKVDNCTINKLSKEYHPLKKLLEKLEKIDNQYSNQHKKLEKMYMAISKAIGSKKREPTFGSVDIVQFLNSNLGDCSESSATYFALFNYFGINTYIKCGQLWEGLLKSDDVHAWPAVDIEKQIIDLDPHWYKTFVPLNSTSIEPITFKEEYMHRKFHIKPQKEIKKARITEYEKIIWPKIKNIKYNKLKDSWKKKELRD